MNNTESVQTYPKYTTISRHEQLEFDIEEMKDDIAIQQFELVAMKHSLDSLELKIEELRSNNEI